MKYWIFTGGEKNALFSRLMRDVREMDNVTLIDTLPKIPDAGKKLWALHHKEKLNRAGTLPFRRIWYPYMPFDENVLQNGSHCFIFNNVSAGYFEPGLLKKWKRKYNLKIVVYFLDVYDSYYSKAARCFVQQAPVDRIYSFYQQDVRKYGFEYLDCYYSKLPVTQERAEFDAFFWGTDGGRRPMIEAMAEQLKKLGYTYKIGICYTDAREPSVLPSSAKQVICYNQPMPYEEVIQNVGKCRVLLDVSGEYSRGVSLRYFEALAYQKKLITNNPLVKEMQLYRPEQILLLDSPGEITKTFMDAEPLLTYDNRFSPVNFIHRLDALWE